MNLAAKTTINEQVTVYAIELNSKAIQFVSLEDGGRVVLFDCGLPGFCEADGVLSPARTPGRLILSHADADHIGDARRLKETFPEMQVLAHEADRAWIEDPALLTRERYDHARRRYGYGYPPELLLAFQQACGGGVQVDVCLQADTRLKIGEMLWSVLHVPGHSPGHLALWNPADRVLLLADAVLGFGIPAVTGGLAMPPTHQFIQDYLTTIERLSSLPVDKVVTGHWPVLDADGFAALLQESRACVLRDLDFVSDRLTREPFSFARLMEELNDRFRRWPKTEDIHYSYALAGYLDYLQQPGGRLTSERLTVPE